MTRSEYETANPEEFRIIVETAPVGYLGILTPDGYPRVVPLNFVADGEIIYFHGANRGEMYEVLKEEPKVTFSIDLPYSVIPSYWTSKKSAGAATMFYKSALVKGRCRLVDTPDEKARILALLTARYQPEGGHDPIRHDSRTYKHILKATIVYRIDPDRVDVHVNFRQKKSDDYKRKLIRKLEERGRGTDLATAEIIHAMLED